MLTDETDHDDTLCQPQRTAAAPSRYPHRMHHPLPVRAAQFASVVAFAVLAVVAVHTASTARFDEHFPQVLDNPWGLTTVVDLNAAFVFAIAVVWLLEPARRVALLVTVLTPVLGAFVPLAWLVARAPHLQRLTSNVK